MDQTPIEPKKIIKQSASSNAAVKVTATSAQLQGGEDQAILSDAALGNIVKGPISFTAHPSEMRFHGFWKLNPRLLSCIPSSIVTPNPVFNFDLPTAGAEELIKESVALMAGMFTGA
jgi:hypothetical protein